MDRKGLGLRVFRSASVCAIVACSAFAQAQYSASVLTPGSFSNGDAFGVLGDLAVGTGWTGSTNHALFWSGDIATDLNPSGFTFSSATAITTSFQVGLGSGSDTGNNNHALLWSGSAASVVDLNPSGFLVSRADGVDGSTQVGSGSGVATSQHLHAVVWSGSAASAVDLNPTGSTESEAFAVAGASQVGTAKFGAGNNHAALWSGSAGSAIDLNPDGFTESWAYGVSGGLQAGFGDGSSTSGLSHALLWNGSAASFVDLNPTGFDTSAAFAIAGSTEVGWGQTTGGDQHALLWNGTPGSAIDLHSFLTGLTYQGNSLTIVRSYATAVDASGNVVGYGFDANQNQYALRWSAPVPEPASIAALAIGALALIRRKRSR